MASMRTPKRLKSDGAISGRYGGLRINIRLNFVISSCVFKLVCGHVFMLKEDFSNIFVRSNSPELLLQIFESFNVQI
jgi:hypothetical protein